MENRSEFHSTDDLATEQFTRPSLDSIDSTIPAPLYTSPYEQVEVDHEIDIEVEQAAMSISASRNLVAPEKTAKRRRHNPVLEISTTTMILAAVAGAGAFILGVIVASMVL
jgi:hypothetical protein